MPLLLKHRDLVAGANGQYHYKSDEQENQSCEENHTNNKMANVGG
jgi:hypothetical protein